jgi:NADH-ubiquinone oxidoreductase chain 6
MENLYVITETFTNGYKAEFLNIISVIAILCGIFVIISKNPIVSVLFLIGLFLSISGYLMILGLNFIGLSYLLVYVGAVSILFLFILMLINVRISELLSNTNNSIPLGIIIGISFYYPVNKILPFSISNINNTFNLFRLNERFDINNNSDSFIKLAENNNEKILFVTSKN